MGKVSKWLSNAKKTAQGKLSDFANSTAGKVAAGIATGGISTVLDAIGAKNNGITVSNDNTTAAPKVDSTTGGVSLDNTTYDYSKPNRPVVPAAEQYSPQVTDAYKSEVENNAKATDDAITQQTATAKAATTSGINEGENKATAGNIGTAATNATAAETYNQMYPAYNSQAASTQADYLEKMGQTAGLDYKAKNMNRANLLNTFGALLGSDENLKTNRGMLGKKKKEEERGNLDPKQLQEAVTQFRTLYKRLKSLKGNLKGNLKEGK